MKIRIEGVNETVDRLWKYRDDFFVAAKKITKKAAQMVVKQGRVRAPQGPTGNLKASIRAKYFWKDGPAATVMPRAKKAPHRHLAQYGTVRRQTAKGKGTGIMPSNRFMDGADNGAKTYFVAAMKAEVDKHVVI